MTEWLVLYASALQGLIVRTSANPEATAKAAAEYADHAVAELAKRRQKTEDK